MKRILIADDHESVLRRVRGIIESQPGWEVCGDAVTGRQAIDKAAELEPDLVILDFAMPQGDGLKTATAIKSILPDVPIVMFTMYCSAVRQEAGKHGIARVVDKAESGGLVAAVEQLLATQKPESVAQRPDQPVVLSRPASDPGSPTDIDRSTIPKAR